jgi:hypothetical protein
MIRNGVVLGLIIALLVVRSLQGANVDLLELDLKPLLPTGLAEIPVVVRLEYSNRSQEDVRVYELVDPFMDFISWRWEANNAPPYEVVVKDLHMAIPSPVLPNTVTIKPGERRHWFFTIPTPSRFGPNVTWTLIATVRSLEKRGEFRRVTTTIIGRDAEVRATVAALGSTRAQAAVLEWPRKGVILQLRQQSRMSVVNDGSHNGDRLADLILFSQALMEKKDVGRHWRGLEDAPEEIRCLRNYLMFLPLQYEYDAISEEEAEHITRSLTPKSPLGPELIERIKSRRRLILRQ